MIRYYILNIALIISLSFNSLAQNECKAKLKIKTNENKSLIFINDELVGTGGVDLDLTPSNYKILIMQSDREWGSEVIQDSILIDKCDQVLTKNYSFTKKTIINSEPAAAVTVNDSILGYTPLSLAMKYKNVSLARHGFESKQIKLNNVPVQPKADLNFIGNHKEEPFIESTLFKVLVGGVVALGATAAYFKLKADDNFDKYLETRQSSYLNNTDNYDLYSGIAFGALQLNFGALLYFFLIE